MIERQDHEEEERGDGGDEEEGPEEDSVHLLRQHPPLSPDLFILVLLTLLVQQSLDNFEQVIMIIISTRTVHPDDVQLGAVLRLGWVHHIPIVPQHSPHHSHEVLLVRDSSVGETWLLVIHHPLSSLLFNISSPTLTLRNIAV